MVVNENFLFQEKDDSISDDVNVQKANQPTNIVNDAVDQVEISPSLSLDDGNHQTTDGINVDQSGLDNHVEEMNTDSIHSDSSDAKSEPDQQESDSSVVSCVQIINFTASVLNQLNQLRSISLLQSISSQVEDAVSSQIDAFIGEKDILWDRSILDDIIAGNYQKVFPSENWQEIASKFLSNKRVSSDVEKYKFYTENILAEKSHAQTLTSSDIDNLYKLAVKHSRIMRIASLDIDRLIEIIEDDSGHDDQNTDEKINLILEQLESKYEQLKLDIENYIEQKISDSIEEALSRQRQEMEAYISSIIQDSMSSIARDIVQDSISIVAQDIKESVQAESQEVARELEEKINALADYVQQVSGSMSEAFNVEGSNVNSEDINSLMMKLGSMEYDVSSLHEAIQIIQSDINAVKQSSEQLFEKVYYLEDQLQNKGNITQTQHQVSHEENKTTNNSEFGVPQSYSEDEKFQDNGADLEDQDNQPESPKKTGIAAILANQNPTKLAFFAGVILLVIGLLIMMKH